MEFQVIIRKTIETVFYVKANNYEKAEDKVKDMLENQENYNEKWTKEGEDNGWDLEEINEE